MKILLTGGGSGGHIIPILAVVEKLKEIKNGNIEFLFLSPNSGFNKSTSETGMQIKIIKAGKLRRYFSWENFTDIFKIIIGIFQSFYYIYKFKPDVVFSKGGFASVPPAIAAWILRKPIVTHESDIVPGLANRIIARFASKILISFSATEKYFDKNKVVLTGNPIRSDITKGNVENALKFFKLSSDLPTILIFGGSQGAQKINKMVLEILPDLIERCQIIHQCGDKNYEEIKNSLKATFANVAFREFTERYKLCPFIKEEMKNAYALAEIVISRAGANSLAEIAVLKKPNILIPLSTSASNHQFKNAEFFAEKNASLIIDETVNNSRDLANAIFKLLSDKNLQNQMRQNLLELSPSQNASQKIAEEIIENFD